MAEGLLHQEVVGEEPLQGVAEVEVLQEEAEEEEVHHLEEGVDEGQNHLVVAEVEVGLPLAVVEVAEGLHLVVAEEGAGLLQEEEEVEAEQQHCQEEVEVVEGLSTQEGEGVVGEAWGHCCQEVVAEVEEVVVVLRRKFFLQLGFLYSQFSEVEEELLVRQRTPGCLCPAESWSE